MYKIEKLNELLRQEIGQILLEDEEFGSGVLVTVMSAKVSPDLRDATIYYSVLPSEAGERVSKKMAACAPHVQYRLIKRLQMHPVPRINFALNQDEAESEKIEKIILKAKKKKQL